MIVTVDESAGFCWGVVRTVDLVEETLEKTRNKDVYILGQIIHNPKETERLEKKGLKTISIEDLPSIDPGKSIVIIRAHGEPPETFKLADKLGLKIKDATCPLVLSLQKRVKKYYDQGYQIIIFGKKEHPEVIGLRGVCNDNCIVIRTVEDACNDNIDKTRKTVLLSQTTMDKPTFLEITIKLKEKFKDLLTVHEHSFVSTDTICRYVADRENRMVEFAKENNVVIFVAGKNSSNGKMLYSICKHANDNTYFIESADEFDAAWLKDTDKVGITGATSTPLWYLNFVKEEIERLRSKDS